MDGERGLDCAGRDSADGRPSGSGGGAPGVEIAQLIDSFHQTLYRYAFRLTGSAADAEDLTQQTFLVAHQKLHQLRDPEKADRWLLAVLRSCFLKMIKKRRPVAASSVALEVDEIPERASSGDLVDRERLQEALNELPADFRLVLAMFYYEQCSYKEIAEHLQIPIGTVMSRLSRAKGRLRRRLLAGLDPSPPVDPAVSAASSGNE